MQITFSLLLDHYVSGVFSLLPIVNPFSTIPLFLALTAGQNEPGRARIALRAVTNTVVILSLTLVAGSLIMEFFGISLPGLRIAGGLIVSYIGFRALFPEPTSPDQAAVDHGTADVSFIPLALPSMAGAGSMAVVLGMSSRVASQPDLATRLLGYVLVIAVILTVGVLSLLVLRSGIPLARMLGKQGIEGIQRVMGFLLVCIGVQFIATGVEGFVSAWASAPVS